MIRLLVFGTWIAVFLAAVTGAVIAWLAGDWHLAFTWCIAGAQACLAIQQGTHAARMERFNHVVGAWRRQDPQAWRR